jgi:hypothetical protein
MFLGSFDRGCKKMCFEFHGGQWSVIGEMVNFLCEQGLLDPKYITTASQVWLYHQLNLSQNQQIFGVSALFGCKRNPRKKQESIYSLMLQKYEILNYYRSFCLMFVLRNES